MEIVQDAWPIVVPAFLGLTGIVGLLAFVSPKSFACVAQVGGRWFSTSKTLPVVESRIDIDQFVLRYSRQFGAQVLLIVCYLSMFFLGHVDPSSTPAFLLVGWLFLMLLMFWAASVSGKKCRESKPS